MNQHSKRGGQANGNRVDEVRRDATRPAAVVAIVLCVGFAAAMVALWSCRKAPSHQEMQTPEPEAAVQNETPEPEAVQTEIPEPEPVSRVWVPDRGVPPEHSTPAPVSQANPAAPQLMNDHVNSPAPVQDGQGNSPTPVQDAQSYDFSHQLNAETITFEAINPTTKVPGRMTATVTGIYRGNRLRDGESPVGSHVQADQRAAFIFVPYDRYSPSYSSTAMRLRLAGDTTNNSIHFEFGLSTTGSDGSSLRFTLREVATVTADAAQVAFEQLR